MAVYKLSKTAKNDLASIYKFGIETFGFNQAQLYLNKLHKQFLTIAEYLRYLVRRDEERNRDFLTTKAAIQEGLDSGVSAKTRTANEIIESAKKRTLAKTKEKKNG